MTAPALPVLADALAHARREVPELAPYVRGMLRDVGSESAVAALTVEMLHRYAPATFVRPDDQLYRLAAVAAEALVRTVSAERQLTAHGKPACPSCGGSWTASGVVWAKTCQDPWHVDNFPRDPEIVEDAAAVRRADA